MAARAVGGGVSAHEASSHEATPRISPREGRGAGELGGEERGALWQQLAKHVTFVRAHEVLGRGARLAARARR